MPFRVMHPDGKTRAYSDSVLLLPEVHESFYSAFWGYCPSADCYNSKILCCPKYINQGEPLFTFELKKITAIFRKGEFTPVVYAPVPGLYLHATMNATDLDESPFSKYASGAGVAVLLEMGDHISQGDMIDIMVSMYGEFCATIRQNAKYLFRRDDSSSNYISNRGVDLDELIEKQLNALPAIVNLWEELPVWGNHFKDRLIDNTVVIN